MSDESKVFAKAAWRLIPFMGLLYVVNYLDRVNVGFAALAMNRDLGLSAGAYGFGAGIFFLGYFLCEVPSNAMLVRVGAKRWIFRIMLSWGAVSMAMALVRTPGAFYTLRFLQGVTEAGFFPGMILYLTFWFPAATRARFNAMFLASILVANIVGSPLSGAILGMNGVAGLHGWQWLFLIEGAPAVLLSFSVLAFLPDGPQDARWLSRAEKTCIADALSAESLPREDLWVALKDVRIWVLGLADIGIITTHYGIGLWLPQVVKATGLSALATGFVVAIPYVVALGVMLAWAQSSDSRHERTVHVVAPALLASASLLAAAFFGGETFTIVALGLALICTYAALVVFWTLPMSILGGSAAAGAIALVNAVGNLGGFLGPSLMGWLKDRTGNYSSGMAVLALGLILTAAVVTAFSRAGVAKRQAVIQ
ncbi:MAG TPA: MFS transporter [Rhizomicrobium sp.]|jgi:ACS family tartrate transporter-like MFS transporter|nr:MFS transporter [Rhizomicrobium sp.]